MKWWVSKRDEADGVENISVSDSLRYFKDVLDTSNLIETKWVMHVDPCAPNDIYEMRYKDGSCRYVYILNLVEDGDGLYISVSDKVFDKSQIPPKVGRDDFEYWQNHDETDLGFGYDDEEGDIVSSNGYLNWSFEDTDDKLSLIGFKYVIYKLLLKIKKDLIKSDVEGE